MEKLPGQERPVLHLVSGAVAHPAEQMLQAMLEGWRSQQLSRGLNVTTIDSGESVVRRFHAHNNEWPWLWTPQMLDDWVSDPAHRLANNSGCIGARPASYIPADDNPPEAARCRDCRRPTED